MFDRKSKEPAGPTLLDRVLKSGAQRVAILGLHAQAGTRTVLASLVRELQARESPLALTSAPRLPLEQEEGADPHPVTRMIVPAGAWIATSAPPPEGDAVAKLDRIETTGWTTTLGPVSVYRVVSGGEADLHGPGEPASMKAVLARLAELSGGLVLVDGGWERRAFAAPGVSDGVIIVLAAGYSATPDRSAAAARYLVETLSVPPCDEAARDAWDETASKGATALLDARGTARGRDAPGPRRSGSGVEDRRRRTRLDGRASARTERRVHDPPRPLAAALHAGGARRHAHQRRSGVLQGVAQRARAHSRRAAAAPDRRGDQPVEPVGTRRGRRRSFGARWRPRIPDLAVHDVVIESGGERGKPVWKFWS